MKQIALIFTLLAANLPLHAAQSLASVLERYLDAETTVVAHLRVEGLLFEPTWTALRGVLPESEDMPTETPVQPWIDALTRAGAKEIYGILSLADASLDLQQIPIFFVVPAGSARVDENLLAETLHVLMPEGGLRQIGEHWVFARPAHLDYVATLTPVPRPELDAAFAVLDPQAHMRVAWIPSADFRKAIRELLPELPQELGGGPGAAVTTLVWASASVRLAPEGQLQAVLQSTDPASAQATLDLLANLRRELGKEREVQESFPAFEPLTARLMPRAAGSRLLTQLDQAGVFETLRSLVTPALGEAREKARGIACINNLKQIGLALHMYAADSKDQFPAESGLAGLQLIMPYLGNASQVLVCPSSQATPAPADAQLTEANISYVYLGGLKLKEIKDPGTVPLAFDKAGNHDAQVNVVFADGHVEAVQGAFASGAALIEHLAAMHNYPPELRAALLEKVKLAAD